MLLLEEVVLAQRLRKWTKCSCFLSTSMIYILKFYLFDAFFPGFNCLVLVGLEPFIFYYFLMYFALKHCAIICRISLDGG